MNSIHTSDNVISKILSMLIFIFFTAFTLGQYAVLIQHYLRIGYNWQFEFYMVVGMIIFQYPFLHKKTIILKIEYYFNMLLVSFLGSVLLVPLILINKVHVCSDTFNISWFFIVVLLMFLDHKRRVKKLELPGYISYTWILYRLIILIFIL